MSALLGMIYVGDFFSETEKKKVGKWHHTSEILVVAMYFSWSMKWIGEDTEKEEQGKSYRSSTIYYIIDMIIFEEMPKLWLIKL